MAKSNRLSVLVDEMRRLFANNPNTIYNIKELRKHFRGVYTDREYFLSIRQLLREGMVNRRVIMHSSYYWLRRG